MVTLEKINIYRKYGGDIDGWAQIGTSKEKQIMVDRDWYLIKDILQDALLIKNKQVSESYLLVVKAKLKSNGVDETLLDEILKLSEV